MELFRKMTGIGSIVIGVGLLVLLHFVNVSDKFSSIMLMSLFIGWIFPYIALVLSGIGILIHSNYWITLVFNIVNILVLILMLFLVIKVYDNKLLVVLIEYIVMLVVSIVSIIYMIFNRGLSNNMISEIPSLIGNLSNLVELYEK